MVYSYIVIDNVEFNYRGVVVKTLKERNFEKLATPPPSPLVRQLSQNSWKASIERSVVTGTLKFRQRESVLSLFHRV